MSATYKKCIVLDLDNTLWGGVVGEDGVTGIELGLTGRGAGFIAFQQALLDLYHRGVLLAVNSHNNPDDALAAIRTHPNMILKEQHFAAMRMNWNDKHRNIAELAEELNIGLDSMVFMDDNPLHRELVRVSLPDVDVPELPEDPLLYAKVLHALDYFPPSALTDEDAMRGNLYVTERLRKSAENESASKEEFLRGLGLEARIAIDDPALIPRIAQLTDKTNQFNTYKRPLSDAEVRALMESPDHEVIALRVVDRLGDYGTIGVMILQKGAEEWVAEQFLMSCRILGRGAEYALAGTAVARAKEAGARRFRFAFAATEKNAPAKAFLDTAVGEPYVLDLTERTIDIPPFITIAELISKPFTK